MDTSLLVELKHAWSFSGKLFLQYTILCMLIGAVSSLIRTQGFLYYTVVCIAVTPVIGVFVMILSEPRGYDKRIKSFADWFVGNWPSERKYPDKPQKQSK